MRHFAKLFLAAAFVCVVFSMPAESQAQYPGYHGCYSSGLGYHAPYRGANAKVLPYFSLYPPVYYSHPVPRPYGYSPFALPPGVEPVEVMAKPVAAKKVVNPYYKRDEAEKAPSDQTAATPRAIANPFYVKSEAKPPVDQVAGSLNDKMVSD